MGYLDRQTQVVWTSPKGNVFNLRTPEGGYSQKHIGEVKTSPNSTKKGSKSSTKKIIESNDTFNDSGVGGKSLSVNFLFIGENHDLEAQKFCSSLCEKGKSLLKMPYEEEITVNVLDFSLKYSTLEKINSTNVSVNFHQTAKTTYPKGSKSKVMAVKNTSEGITVTIAQNLSETIESINEEELLEAVNSNFSLSLEKIADNFDTINSSALDGIIKDLEEQSFTKNAYTMMHQVSRVFDGAIGTILKAKNIEQIIPNGAFKTLCSKGKRLFDELFSVKSFFGSKLNREQIVCLNVADSLSQEFMLMAAKNIDKVNFVSRKEAIEAASALVELEKIRSDFIDEQKSKIDELEDVFINEADINSLINSAASAILEDSFNLKVERVVELAQDEAVINLVYKYYPEEFELEPDDTLEYFIETNNLSDEEFFILKKGSRIKIYV